MKPLEDFVAALCALCDALDSEGIDWAVAGAVAANNYRDQIRTTTDLDVILSLTDQNVQNVLDALHHYGWDSIEVVEDWLLRAQHPVTGRLDVLVSQTEYEKGALDRAQTVTLDERHTCKTLTIEDVLILKLIANRYRDNDDVESILVTRPNLDWDYMSRWINEFGLQKRLQRIENAALTSGRMTQEITSRLRQRSSD